jgi:two-component system, NarL family, response regulator DegU
MSDIKIMIAEDQTLFREGMIAVLESLDGIKIIGEAGNGKDLIDKLENELPDVVLLDLKMPVMDGFEALKHIKKNYPAVKVIILTMHEDEDFVVEIIENGANSYLLKDTSLQELNNTIKKVMENEYYYVDYVQKIIAKRFLNKKNTRIHFNTDKLNEQELEVLKLICQEFSNAQIGDKVNLSSRTVEGYKRRLQNKVGAKSLIGLVIYAIKNGLVD